MSNNIEIQAFVQANKSNYWYLCSDTISNAVMRFYEPYQEQKVDHYLLWSEPGNEQPQLRFFQINTITKKKREIILLELPTKVNPNIKSQFTKSVVFIEYDNSLVPCDKRFLEAITVVSFISGAKCQVMVEGIEYTVENERYQLVITGNNVSAYVYCVIFPEHSNY